MTNTTKTMLRAILYACGTVAAIIALSAVPIIQVVGVVLVPGALLAALIFPEGIHSDHGLLFLALSALFDVALLAIPLFFIFKSGRFQKPPIEVERP